MTKIDDLLLSEEQEEASRAENDQPKPELFLLDSGQLPFERLGDAHFEMIIADLYMYMSEEGGWDWYDHARRMNDGADGGRDVILLKSGVSVGVIQCKRYIAAVGLPDFIPEIIKFFLNSLMEPAMISPPGDDFTYVLSVSDKTTADLLNFLVGTGADRFNKLRADFEVHALKVKNKYTKIKNHPLFSNLDTGAKICDLFWDRLVTVTTRVHRKDDLSRMVAKFSVLKGTYFKCDGVGGASPEEIKKLLQQFYGLSAAQMDEKLSSSIRTEYVDVDLMHDSRINIGLIQGAGTDVELLLHSLLSKPNELLRSNFGSRPAILACGAAAISPSRWGYINDLVSGYRSELVLIVGCGVVSGALLNDWRDSDGDGKVWIDPGWEPAIRKDYRVGWCWVKHTADEHRCFILVENKPQVEVLDHSNMSLRLAFRDVVIWPTLGDDFINVVQDPKSQLRRIFLSQKEDRLLRPNLLIAVQHRSAADGKITQAVSDYYTLRSNSKVAMLLVNSDVMSDQDQVWKGLTGIFPAVDGTDVTCNASLMSPPGQVTRRTGAGALLMTLNWGELDAVLRVVSPQPYRCISSKIEEDLSAEDLEFSKLFERYPATSSMDCSVATEMSALLDLIDGKRFFRSDEFTWSTMHGVKPKITPSINAINVNGDCVMDAVHALCYLKSDSNTCWRSSSYGSGQMDYSVSPHKKINIMAWWNNQYSVREMEAELLDWSKQAGEHPDLLVFAKGKGRVTGQGFKVLERGRLDISVAHDQVKSITEPGLPRSAYVFALDEVESTYYDSKAVKPASELMKEILIRKVEFDA